MRLEMRAGLTSLIGPNNCGKSTILKFFYEQRDLLSALQNINSLKTWSRGEPVAITSLGVGDPIEIFHNRNERPVEIEVVLPNAKVGQVSGVRFIAARDAPNHWRAKYFHGPKFEPLNAGDEYPYFSGGSKRIQMDGSALVQFGAEMNRSIYMPSTRVAIGEAQGDSFDLAFGARFIQQWDQWKTGPNRRQNDAIQRVTGDIAKLFGFDRFDIAATPEKRDLHIAIDGRAFKLRELGSGLAQFVIVLGNAAIRRPPWLMIDEPEISLHPQLQLDFITTISSYVGEGTLFATHSLGLARSADRIFSIRDHGGHTQLRPFEQTGSFQEFLGEMSFAAYRELGFDAVLLVEGINDIKTVQQFLRLLRRDHRVVVLQLGGSQMIRAERVTELTEVLRLTKNVHVLIDSERKHDGDAIDRQRSLFLAACSNVGIRGVATARRALEHYLTDRNVKAAFGDAYRAMTPFEDRSGSQVFWQKSESWRAAREMTKVELESTDVGRFLAQI